MEASKEFSVVEFVKTSVKSRSVDLAKIYKKNHYKKIILDLTRWAIESSHEFDKLSNDEFEHLRNIQRLIIRLLHNTFIHRSDTKTFFEHFSQYEFKSMSLISFVAKYLKTKKSPNAIKILCGWLDIFSHYTFVMGDELNNDEIRQFITQHLDYPMEYLPYLGSFLFYFASIRNFTLVISSSASRQCRDFVISSANEIQNWSSDTLHSVMGIVFALPMENSEDYHQALFTIVTNEKLQGSLFGTCANDESMLIHSITENFVQAINFERMSIAVLKKSRKSLQILHRNAKYSLTKANICYLLSLIASEHRHLSDRMLIEYFECISQLRTIMKNMLKRREKREQLIRGIQRACNSDFVKQTVIRLNETEKLVIIDKDLKHWIKSITRSLHSSDGNLEGNVSRATSLPLNFLGEMSLDARRSPTSSPVVCYESLPPARHSYHFVPHRSINSEIEMRCDIVIHCTPASSPVPVKNHLERQGYSVLILNKNSNGHKKEKNILRCKTMIVYINDDYDQHRSELVLAYKNQVPIILMITGDQKEIVCDDYFLQFIFEQSSHLSNIIDLKDFNEAMIQLTNVVKHVRRIHKLDARKQPTSPRSENAPTTEDLYNACRSNDVEKVRQLLRQMSIDSINHLTKKGTTALHIASFRGHDEIVRLLLDAGASTTIRNRPFHMTAYEEASKLSTKHLFHLHRDKDSLSPFINNDLRIEWTCAYQNPIKKRHQLKAKLNQLLYVKNYDYESIFKEIRTSISYALNDSSLSLKDVEIIKGYFKKLKKESDLTHFIKCYSSTTSFHRYFNEYLAKNGLEFFDHHLVNLNTDYRAVKSFLQLVSMVMHHDQFHQMKFRGKTYRGLLMTNDDLQKYIQGSQILNTSFLSTSKAEYIARMFSGNEQAAILRKTHDKNALQYSVMCVYNIKNQDSALDIESISERRSDEKEVLILPFSAFKVEKVQKTSTDSIEIILEEMLDEDITV